MTDFERDSEREAVERLLATLRDGDTRDVDLVPAVLDRIRGSKAAAPARDRHRRRRRTAVVVVVASIGLAACAVIPPVREAVVALFRVNGIVVRQGPPSPSPTPTPPASTGPSPSASVASVYAGLGERITVAEADAGSQGRLLLPSALGPPDVVYRRGALVTLGYGGEHPRWLVMEVVEPSTVLLEKIALTGSHVHGSR